MQANLIFLDTETTGIDQGRLIQLAYKKRGDKNVFVEYYKPPVPIEIEAMAVHHITEKKIADKPPFGKSGAYAELSGLLADSIVVAHNAKFDLGVLEAEGIKTNRHICTLKVALSMYDYPSYKLQYLRYLWGIDVDEATAHDAGGDVMVLEGIFEHMAKDYASIYGTTEDKTIDAFVDISNKPVLLRRVNFGKYAGKTFEEVKALDLGYLQWMGTLQDKDDNFIYTVKHYLGGDLGVADHG
jgi:exodeoxyribonuclease X